MTRQSTLVDITPSQRNNSPLNSPPANNPPSNSRPRNNPPPNSLPPRSIEPQVNVVPKTTGPLMAILGGPLDENWIIEINKNHPMYSKMIEKIREME